MSDPECLLRVAVEHDREGVRALLQRAALVIDGFDDQFPAAYIVAERTASERSSALVGVAGVEVYGSSGLLRSVATSEHVRGHGVGKALVHAALDVARTADLDALYLLTTTAPDFFARLGFSRIERAEAPARVRASTEFAGACPSEATCMRIDVKKNLRPPTRGSVFPSGGKHS